MGCKVRCIAVLIVTLLCTAMVPSSAALVVILPAIWFCAFKPLSKIERVIFLLATITIIGQNYMVLRSGTFRFRQEDILGMPYYEPLMWGFYALSIKRWVYDRKDVLSPVGRRNIVAFLLTGLVFGLLSFNSLFLTLASSALVLFLFFWFHDRTDLRAASYALGMGLAVELLGVHTGQWTYPSPVLLGLPLWSVSMWLSVGILFNRFLLPVSAWFVEKMSAKHVS